MFDIVIIGAGISGACIARELSKYDLKVLILEKNNDVATETTKANSAIIHAGFDAKENSLMAKFNVLGNSMFDELARELNFPFKRNGSLVIARNEEELESIKALKARGEKNNVPDLYILSKDETLKLEPYLKENILGSLLAKTGAIVGPWEMTTALLENAVDNGVKVLLSEEVVDITKEDDTFNIFTQNSEFHSKVIINCAGIHADTIHNMICEKSYKISPRKGEYFVLTKDEGEKFNHTIFQAPTSLGKGILVTPTVHGNLLVGPDAEDIYDKSSKSTSQERLKIIMETSKKTSDKINFGDQIRQFSGLRAESDRNDFIIEEDSTVKNFIDVGGIKSPGLSSAPAVALEVLDILSENFNLKKKEKFISSVKKYVIFSELNYQEKNKLIKENPKYGRIVCKCENITEAEIIDSIHRNIGATTVDGVKRRCRPGMGTCQGAFCGPKIQEILARELDRSLEEIFLDSKSSYILTKETKGDN